MGHALMENRSGLVVEAGTDTGQRPGGARGRRSDDRASFAGCAAPLTLGADKGYDASGFVADLRVPKVTPHIAQNLRGRRSAIVGRTTRHPRYAMSQQKRKRTLPGAGAA